jgi:hypothetical protein
MLYPRLRPLAAAILLTGFSSVTLHNLDKTYQLIFDHYLWEMR